MSNRHFANLLDFALKIGPRFTASEQDILEFRRMMDLRDDGFFWPGRGLTIEEDFENCEALQFWSKVFFEVAQSVFLREIGNQSNTQWQTQMIFFAMGTANLFLKAARMSGEVGKAWFPETRASTGNASIGVRH
ncbi:hypothetical protein [Pseudaestuariivita sp.]|uniref:hypothetical protein n=1 Tax=Pseudaestuariivita sp. TaxID=2211669 RepID=UPI004058BBB2